MALKFNLKSVSKDEIDKAKSEFTGQYDGPTPQPGLYNVKVTNLWSTEDKQGKPLMIARLQFDNDGEAKEYNGYSILHRLNIPDDPTDQYFAIRLKSLDDFLRAVSGGKMDVGEFVDLANAGKIIAGKKEKLGEPITQIGKFKLEKAENLTIKTKPPHKAPNGNEYVNVHYIDTRNVGKPDNDDDEDYDDDVADDDDNDIDDMLEDMDD